MELILSFLIAFALALGVTPLVRAGARRSGWVAQPRQDRWHSRPTALLGGIAIFAAFVVTSGILGLSGLLWPWMAAAAFMFAVGLVDDLRPLRPATKLIMQLVAGAALVASGYHLELTAAQPLNQIVTVFWVVAITNAFNLLDNMDGLAAGVAALATFTFLAMLSGSGGHPMLPVAAAFAGALSGFLVYNFHPASIFMGDSGSLFIGCFLASIVLVDPEPSGSRLVSILAGPVLLLIVPIADTTFVAVSRLLAGRRVSVGGRDHTSHRLVALGLPERTAVLALYAIAAGAGALAFWMQYAGPAWTVIVLAMYLVAIALLAVYLGGVGVYAGEDFARLRNRSYTPLLFDLTYRRHIFEVMLDFLLAAVAYYAAYRIRFDDPEFAFYFPIFLKSLAIVLACRVGGLLVAGAYRGVWRYFGLSDVATFLKGVALGSVASVLLVLYLYRFEDFSRGVFIIDALLFAGLVIGSRLSFRLLSEFVSRRKAQGLRALVYGAGDGGMLVVREMLNNADLDRRPIGFIDDDRAKHGRRISGLPVLGGFDLLEHLVRRGELDEVVVSTMRLDQERLRRLVDLCAERDIQLVRMRLMIDRLSEVAPVRSLERGETTAP